MLQKNSSQSFRDLVDKFSKEDQTNLWNMTRYPELISEIVTGEVKSKEELKLISKKYPQELESSIIKYGQKDYSTLSTINNLYINSY